jgi:hypothetical protein
VCVFPYVDGPCSVWPFVWASIGGAIFGGTLCGPWWTGKVWVGGGYYPSPPSATIPAYPLPPRVRTCISLRPCSEWIDVLSANDPGYLLNKNLLMRWVYPLGPSRTWSVPLFVLCCWSTCGPLGIGLLLTLLEKATSSGANVPARAGPPGRLRGAVRSAAPPGTAALRLRPSRPFRVPGTHPILPILGLNYLTANQLQPIDANCHYLDPF